jgi:hypothetical protein
MIKEETKQIDKKISRKSFFQIAGAGVAVLAVAAAGCKASLNDPSPANTDANDVGSGDTGLLNYLLTIEAVEAAFYTQAVLTPYTGVVATETALLTDIRDHQISYRELYKAYLNVAVSPATMTFNFASVDFTSRTAVLTAAQTLEDLAVAAYNGSASLFASSSYLNQIGKIVSVKARHSAVIRNLITPGSFADSTAVDKNGLDIALLPSQVLIKAKAYISSQVTAKLLP